MTNSYKTQVPHNERVNDTISRIDDIHTKMNTALISRINVDDLHLGNKVGLEEVLYGLREWRTKNRGGKGRRNAEIMTSV